MLKRTIEKYEKLNIIELYCKFNYSLNQLQSLAQSDKRSIRDYLLANNIKVSGLNEKTIVPNKNILGLSKSDKRFNFDIFKIIDTEEKAYWLGFIFADGYIGNNEKTFELGLQARDVGHLHKFNRFMECVDNNVHYHYKKTNGKIFDSYRWCIKNENLWNILNSYGCVPNKSLKLKFPNKNIFQNLDLVRHFIRGYWDGDGCITITAKSNLISVLGTDVFLNELKKMIPNLTDNKIYLKKCIGNKTFTLQTGNKKAYNTLNYLYKDASIYLDRKYDKYLDFCKLYN